MKKKDEILRDIEENGGFDNFNKWNKREIAEWVRYNYECTYYTSIKVGEILWNNWNKWHNWRIY